ncbi:DgyrCDS9208 [Dimorphilus gyrociliatus]|nr:DgyrCDS9208 [Dimorphilus gyrociliatus]
MYSKKCFENQHPFESGEYRAWNCMHPTPVGRYAIVYLPLQESFSIFQMEAYGEEIANDDLSPLPIIKADRNSDNGSFDDRDAEQQYSIKAVDQLPFNVDWQQVYFSCTGNFKDNHQEGRFTIYLDNVYLVRQIVLLSLLPFNTNNFEDVQIAVENSFMQPQRQFCHLATTVRREHELYNCSLIGDRISFYKIDGTNKIRLCEVYVLGKKQAYNSVDLGTVENATMIFSMEGSTPHMNSFCDYSTNELFFQLKVYHKLNGVGFTLMETKSFTSDKGLQIFGINEKQEYILCSQFRNLLKITSPTPFTFPCSSEIIAKYVRIFSSSGSFRACNYYVISKQVVNNLIVNYRLEQGASSIIPSLIYATETNLSLLDCYKSCIKDDKCESFAYSTESKACMSSKFEILSEARDHLTTSTSLSYSVMYKKYVVLSLVCNGN